MKIKDSLGKEGAYIHRDVRWAFGFQLRAGGEDATVFGHSDSELI